MIARSGATTVAELAAVGIASVLVPYPHAADDHQGDNARQLAARDAAVLIRSATCRRRRSPHGSRASRASGCSRWRAPRGRCARRDAAERVADVCIALGAAR